MGKPVDYNKKQEDLQNLVNDVTETLKQKNTDLQKFREEQEKLLKELTNDSIQESSEVTPLTQFNHQSRR